MDAETSLAIQAIYNEFNKYCSKTIYAALNNTVTLLTNRVVTLENTVTALQTTVQKLNKLTELLDVTITDIKEGDILQYSNNKWVNIKPSLVISDDTNNLALSALSDVNLTTLSNGQVLTYNTTNSKWTNSTISGEGGTSYTDYSQVQALANYTSLFTSDVNTILSASTLFVKSLNGTATNLTIKDSSGNIRFIPTTTGITVTGDTLSTGEITAYTI